MTSDELKVQKDLIESGQEGEERGKISWQRGPQTLPEAETSAQAGSLLPRPASGSKLKLQGFCSAVKSAETRLERGGLRLTDQSITSTP